MSRAARSQRGSTRRYAIRLTVALVAYGVLLVVALLSLQRWSGSGWRWVVMALPLPAVAGVVVAVARWIGEADELQSAIVVRSLAIGFAGGSMITFGYGLMQIAGAPVLSWLWVWPVYATCWLVGRLIIAARY